MEASSLASTHSAAGTWKQQWMVYRACTCSRWLMQHRSWTYAALPNHTLLHELMMLYRMKRWTKGYTLMHYSMQACCGCRRWHASKGLDDASWLYYRATRTQSAIQSRSIYTGVGHKGSWMDPQDHHLDTVQYIEWRASCTQPAHTV